MSNLPDAASIPKDIKSRLKASYDIIAPTYNLTFVKPNDPVRLDYLHHLLTYMQKNGATTNDDDDASVLELGCGAGIPGTRTLLENHNPRLHVIANDLSSTQINLARSNLAAYTDRLELVQGDMLALDFPNASFNAIVAFYSIIHLPRTEQTELMHKMAAWLKPGGFFLANFAQEEIESVVDPTWLGVQEGWVYWSGWGEEGSVRMVESAGLEVLVREVRQDAGDAKFVWVLGRKKSGGAV